MEVEKDRENLSSKYLRCAIDLPRKLAEYEMHWGESVGGPPASWKEGAPIGNGDFGALIYGHPDNLSFALGKSDLWDRSGEPRSNFKGHSFDESRRIYEQRDEEAFARLCDLPEVCHKQHATTAGMFRLHLHDSDSVIAPEMGVSLYDGIATLQFVPIGIDTNWTLFGQTRAEFLVSRTSQALAIKIVPSVDRPEIKQDPTSRTHEFPQKAPLGTAFWELSRAPHAPHEFAETGEEEGIIWLKQCFANGDNYVVAFTISGGVLSQQSLRHRICGDMTIPGTTSVEIFLTIVSSRDCSEPLKEAKRRLSECCRIGFTGIREAHLRWWHEYWHRSWVHVGDSSVEKWWYTSLYICGSIIEPGRQSPGLQGVWTKENVPAWFGDYHSNVNIQAVYWGLFGANHVEMLEPYIRLLQQLEPQARRDTKEFFGMEGIRFPHSASIDGYELTLRDWAVNLGVSVGGSSWLTQLAWQVFEYTGDRELLRNTVYPLLKDVVIFYEEYLKWDEANNRWTLEPSLFFEALCPRSACWGRNSLYELALVRSAVSRAIAASIELNVDSADRTRWTRILEEMSEFPTNEEGTIWIGFEGRDLRSFGSHQFALPPVFPAELVSLWHGPEKWRRQALATLKDMSTKSSKTGKSWCGGQGIREIIRMGCAEEAWAEARWSNGAGMANKPTNINSLNHGWSSHWLQADHSPGMCSVLNDMLLLTTEGVIRLFAGIPADIPVAFHSLRAPGAFLVSAERRNGNVGYAIIMSLAGRELRLAKPWSGCVRIRDAKSLKSIQCSEVDDLRCDTVKGQVLVVDSLESPYESFVQTTGDI